MYATYGEICYTFNWTRRGKSYRFRMGTVPHTAKSRPKSRYGHYFKYPKTTQERRLSLKFNKFVRAKRNSNNLPHAWDDLTKYSSMDKSWKACSKKRYQWMKKHNKSKWLIKKQDRLWEEYLFNSDRYMNLKFISKFDELAG